MDNQIDDIELTQLIIKYTERCMKRLKLSPIRIETEKFFPDCSYYHPLCPEMNKPYICFGLNFLRDLSDKYTWNLKLIDKVFLVTAHEIAHYFQHTYYPNWHEIYKSKDCYAQIKHKNTKIEKNATKIAFILLREWQNERR